MTRWLRLAPLLLLACGPGRRSFEEPVVLDGVSVAPDVLNRGEMAYMRYCRGCHGQQGRGDGPYASSMEPRPANLTTGQYGAMSADRMLEEQGLPSDEALDRVVREGVGGMQPVEMPDEDRAAVVQYVKTLSPRWRAE